VNEERLTRMRAQADQQYAEACASLAGVANQARTLLGEGFHVTAVWATLAAEMGTFLDCQTMQQQYAVYMVAAAAVQMAGSDPDSERQPWSGS
jgi:hypothetical protein